MLRLTRMHSMVAAAAAAAAVAMVVALAIAVAMVAAVVAAVVTAEASTNWPWTKSVRFSPAMARPRVPAGVRRVHWGVQKVHRVRRVHWGVQKVPYGVRRVHWVVCIRKCCALWVYVVPPEGGVTNR